MTFKEIETKYGAGNIKLQEFDAFCQSLRPKSLKQLSSYDHYYIKSDKEFLRYRAGAKPELTIKKKTKSKNNFVRIEVNLELDPSTPETRRFKTVQAFCNGLGFTHNFSIYKTCHIYFYDKFNFVYYVVYDCNLVEQARFLEIEMDEDYKWPNKTAAWKELLRIEKKLKVFGITAKDRILESLFEMFREI